MKLAVIGSRTWNNKKKLFDALDCMEITHIISGGTVGADSYAQAYAKSRGLTITIFYPKYQIYQQRAPLIRNIEIAKFCDAAVAFVNSNSSGTQHTIKNIRKLGKTCKIIRDGDGFTLQGMPH